MLHFGGLHSGLKGYIIKFRINTQKITAFDQSATVCSAPVWQTFQRYLTSPALLDAGPCIGEPGKSIGSSSMLQS
eukprot:3966697-Amphidinium_carterae.1